MKYIHFAKKKEKRKKELDIIQIQAMIMKRLHI